MEFLSFYKVDERVSVIFKDEAVGGRTRWRQATGRLVPETVTGEQIEDVLQCPGDGSLENGCADDYRIRFHQCFGKMSGVPTIIQEIAAVTELDIKVRQIKKFCIMLRMVLVERCFDVFHRSPGLGTCNGTG